MKRIGALHLLFFLTGVLVATAISFYQSEQQKKSFQNQSNSILNYDPYEYENIKKSSQAFFTKYLPDDLKTQLQQKFPNRGYLTSCKGDFIPADRPEYALGFAVNGKAQVLIVSTDSQGSLNWNAVPVQMEIPEKSFVEIKCSSGSYILNTPKFSAVTQDKNLIQTLSYLNRDVLLFKTREASSYGVVAFNSDNLKFEFIGNYAPN